MPYDIVRSPKNGVKISFAGIYDFLCHYIIIKFDVIKKGSVASDSVAEAAEAAYVEKVREDYRKVILSRYRAMTREWPYLSSLLGFLKKKPLDGE